MKLLPLFLLAGSCFAGDIVSAYGHIPAGGFRVPIPDAQIAWKDLAQQIVGKDVGTPSESRLTDLWQNKDSFGTAEVNFQAPVPAAMKSRRYYVISADGLTPLRMRGLVGSVRYGFEEGGTQSQLKQVAFGGNAIFDTVPEDTSVEGAFVIDSDAPITSTVAEVQPTAITVAKDGDAARVTYDGHAGRIATPTTSRPDYAAAISIASDNYLFLQWHPEGRSCEFIFTLMKITAAGLDEAASTVYGCDF